MAPLLASGSEPNLVVQLARFFGIFMSIRAPGRALHTPTAMFYVVLNIRHRRKMRMRILSPLVVQPAARQHTARKRGIVLAGESVSPLKQLRRRRGAYHNAEFETEHVVQPAARQHTARNASSK